MNALAIKNYREPEQYLRERDHRLWRWEFLRRNAEYQSRCREISAAGNRKIDGTEFNIRFLTDPFDDDGYRHIFGSGVVALNLPSVERLAQWKKKPHFSADRMLDAIVQDLTKWQSSGNRFFVVNRALPIDAQLEAIRKSVQDENEMDDREIAVKTGRRQEWTEYLRILDGRASGDTFAEIAKVVRPYAPDRYPDRKTESTIRLAYNAALKLTKSFAAGLFVAREK